MKILKSLNQKQHGFTAIELVVGIIIIGLIATAVATGIAQAFNGTISSNDRMSATNNVRVAGDWISDDVKMVEGSVQLNVSGVLIRVEWSDYPPPNGDPPHRYLVDYTLSNGKLYRLYQEFTGNPPVLAGQQTVLIAQNITVGTCTFSNNTLTLTLTSTFGSVSETRTFVIAVRNLPW
ncbi:MAG TPA: prepilin-type N-terminal cleavage/methylation domain-containing protein [Dehalococcoidales bacterium]